MICSSLLLLYIIFSYTCLFFYCMNLCYVLYYNVLLYYLHIFYYLIFSHILLYNYYIPSYYIVWPCLFIISNGIPYYIIFIMFELPLFVTNDYLYLILFLFFLLGFISSYILYEILHWTTPDNIDNSDFRRVKAGNYGLDIPKDINHHFGWIQNKKGQACVFKK